MIHPIHPTKHTFTNKILSFFGSHIGIIIAINIAINKYRSRTSQTERLLNQTTSQRNFINGRTIDIINASYNDSSTQSIFMCIHKFLGKPGSISDNWLRPITRSVYKKEISLLPELFQLNTNSITNLLCMGSSTRTTHINTITDLFNLVSHTVCNINT